MASPTGLLFGPGRSSTMLGVVMQMSALLLGRKTTGGGIEPPPVANGLETGQRGRLHQWNGRAVELKRRRQEWERRAGLLWLRPVRKVRNLDDQADQQIGRAIREPTTVRIAIRHVDGEPQHVRYRQRRKQRHIGVAVENVGFSRRARAKLLVEGQDLIGDDAGELLRVVLRFAEIEGVLQG